MQNESISELEEFLNKIPAVKVLSYGHYSDNTWWIKINIDVQNTLSWNIVQELGHILNYLSIDEKLPTIFYPISPPPYMNGGPKDYLNWIIESKNINFLHSDLLYWLNGRLPKPVNDLSEWVIS